MKCSIHPSYCGRERPRSRDPKCVCAAIYRSGRRQGVLGVPSRPVTDPVVEIVSNEAATEPEDPVEATEIPRYPATNGSFSNGRPRPAIITEPLVESADSLIEATLAQRHPELHVVRAPAGYRLRGASTLVDSSGEVVQQWIKTMRVQDDPAYLVQLAKAAVLADPIVAAPLVRKTQATASEYEVAIVIGDAHFGMLAWDKETGDDWDVDIARETHVKAIREALLLSPASSRLLLINLGDAVHADGNSATTTAGTRVDVDSRWSKVVGIFVETINLAIAEGLQRHDHVEVVTMRGNHDDLTSIVIRMVLAERWRDNPRVTVADNLKMIWSHKFGSNLICAMHGDKTRLNQIPTLIAADFRKEWGETKHALVYAGHIHHHKAQEFPGIEVEYMRVLCAKDAWHHGQGYRSRRSLRCDVWHHEYGRVTTHEIGVEQLA